MVVIASLMMYLLSCNILKWDVVRTLTSDRDQGQQRCRLRKQTIDISPYGYVKIH